MNKTAFEILTGKNNNNNTILGHAFTKVQHAYSEMYLFIPRQLLAKPRKLSIQK